MTAVFRWEMRKIWRPGLLVLLAALGVLYFIVFSRQWVEYEYGGKWDILSYGMLAERFGPTLDESERPELDEVIAEQRREFASELAAIPGSAERGLTDYDGFYTFMADINNDEDNLYANYVWEHTNYYVVYELEYVAFHFDNRDTLVREQNMHIVEYHPEEFTEAQRERMTEVYMRSDPLTLLPQAADRPRYYTRSFAVWCVLSAVLLLAPTLVRDRLRHTRALQWSSRHGRRILRSQFAAGCVSGGVLTLVNIILYAIPLIVKDRALLFVDCPIGKGNVLWFDCTKGQYTLIICAIVLTLTLGASLLTVFVSQYSSNYVSMLLKAVPLFYVLGYVLAPVVVENPFFVVDDNNLPPGGEAMLAAAVLALGAALCATAVHRQRRRELS